MTESDGTPTKSAPSSPVLPDFRDLHDSALQLAARQSRYNRVRHLHSLMLIATLLPVAIACGVGGPPHKLVRIFAVLCPIVPYLALIAANYSKHFVWRTLSRCVSALLLLVYAVFGFILAITWAFLNEWLAASLSLGVCLLTSAMIVGLYYIQQIDDDFEKPEPWVPPDGLESFETQKWDEAPCSPTTNPSHPTCS